MISIESREVAPDNLTSERLPFNGDLINDILNCQSKETRRTLRRFLLSFSLSLSLSLSLLLSLSLSLSFSCSLSLSLSLSLSIAPRDSRLTAGELLKWEKSRGRSRVFLRRYVCVSCQIFLLLLGQLFSSYSRPILVIVSQRSLIQSDISLAVE